MDSERIQALQEELQYFVDAINLAPKNVALKIEGRRTYLELWGELLSLLRNLGPARKILWRVAAPKNGTPAKKKVWVHRREKHFAKRSAARIGAKVRRKC
jgi:hypothetical protein